MTNMINTLESAAHNVSGPRQEAYGSPTVSMGNIADLWSAYLSTTISAEQVAHMMTLLKIARTKAGYSEDNYVDAAGYQAIAAECAAVKDPLPEGETAPDTCRSNEVEWDTHTKPAKTWPTETDHKTAYPPVATTPYHKLKLDDDGNRECTKCGRVWSPGIYVIPTEPCDG